MSARRQRVLDWIADHVPDAVGDDCVRVAVDGVDGAGKTMLADELAETLGSCGRSVVRVSIDDFHHGRALRYRQGRHSPQGYWLDSYEARVTTSATYKNTGFCWPNTVYSYYTNIDAKGRYNGDLVASIGGVSHAGNGGCAPLHDHWELRRVTG